MPLLGSSQRRCGAWDRPKAALSATIEQHDEFD